MTRVIRKLSPDQPVERAATLEDVRTEVLSPERLNAFVFTGFAGIALLIAVVGVAGVLAFSVSARTREFGIRLAVGSAPRQLLARVLSEGVLIAAVGIAAGAAVGFGLARVAARFSKTCNCRVHGQSLARRPSSSPPRSSPHWYPRRGHRGWMSYRHSDRNRTGVMSTAQIDAPTAPKPLRLWPGVAAAALLVLAGYVTPIFMPSTPCLE